MTFVVIFLIVIAVLFGLVFMTRRRFGVLGLALAAGAMLSSLWVGDLTPLVAEAGIVIVKPPLESLVAAFLTLLPALLLLFSGPTYSSLAQRTGGALAFSLLAIALLLEPLRSALVIEGVGQQVYDYFVTHNAVLVTIGLVVALLDILISKPPKFSHKH